MKMRKLPILFALLFHSFFAFAQTTASEENLIQNDAQAPEEKSVEQLEKTLQCPDLEDNSPEKAECLIKAADAYEQQENLSQAQELYLQAHDIYKAAQDEEKIAILYNKLGKLFLRPTTYYKSLEFYQKANALALEIKSQEALVESCNGLANVYEKLFFYRDALVYRRKYEEELEKYQVMQKEGALSELEGTFKDVKKEDESTILAQNEKIKILEAGNKKLKEQQRNTIIVTSFTGLLAFLAVGFAVRRRKPVKPQPAPAIIPDNAEEKERLENSQLILEDLKSGLSRISSLSDVIVQKTAYLQDVKGNSETVKQTSVEMLEKMGDLLWVLNPERSTISSLILRMRQFARDFLKDSGVEPVFHIPDQLPETSISKESRTQLYSVVKESLDNVARHSSASKVIFTANLLKDMLLITIIDNGNGFILGDHNPGNGLKKMKEKLEELGGVCEITSKIGQGTMISISISLDKMRNPKVSRVSRIR